jgi:hypothetical protein
MEIQEFFNRLKCTRNEMYLLLNYLQCLRINKVINNVNEIKRKLNLL